MALDLTRWSPEQRRAIQASGHNVLVSAGAGSGKTSVLVERVVRHVMEPGGTDLLRLLVVTFTEAAAAEMRRRIEQRLRGLLEEARANADARTAARLQRLLSQVEQAQISTLHSFCMQVVRDNFAFLGLNPVFSLLSEDDGVLLRAEVLEGLLEAELAGENGAMLAQTVTHLAGGNPDTFRQLVLRLHDFAVSQPEPLAWLAAMAALYDSAGAPAAERLPWYPPFIRWAKRQLDAALRDFEQAHRVAATSEGLSSYAENLTALLNLCQSTRAALDEVSDFSAAADALLAIRGLKTPRTSAKGWDKEWVTARRNAGLARVKRVLPWFERGLDALCDDVLALRPHVHTLVAFVRAFHARYQEVKRANGQLDFYDLEHFTLAVLSNPASGEADRLREQFDELLIDEYQDTSPIQDAIVQCLTKPEGNQFVVGDVKQSIYRFRMAEPNLFLDKYQMLGRLEPGEVIDLTANYRSRPEVVHAVNFLFEQLFSPAMGGLVYDERARMQVGARYPEEALHTLAGPVDVFLLERSQAAVEDATSEDEAAADADEDGDDGLSLGDDMPSAAELLAIEREAAVIAQQIREWMGQASDSTQKVVWDPAQGMYRPLQYRDIVILLRSVKGRMTAVLEVLRQHGIPAYGATSTGFYGALEIGWILSTLNALDNPRRDLDLAALLRSPMAGFKDVDLARLRLLHRGTLYDGLVHAARVAPEEAAHTLGCSVPTAEALVSKCRQFLHQFREWRRFSRKSGVEDVIRRVLDDTGLEQYVAGMTGGDVRRANLQALLDRARAFDRQSGDGVFGFVQFAEAILQQNVDVGEARTLGEQEDVVRVMTIHQSKGLEFPVVFVADLGKLFYRNPLERAVPIHRSLGFGPKRVDADNDQRWPTLPSLTIEDLEWTEFLAEEARVLYVACTRAREKLVLVGSARDLHRRLERAVSVLTAADTVLPDDVLTEARTYLDWLLPALVRHRDGTVLRRAADAADVQGGTSGLPLWDHPASFCIRLWDVPGWPQVTLPQRELAAASTHPVHHKRMTTVDDVLRALGQEAASVTEPCDWVIESADTGSDGFVPGKVSATDLRRLWAARYADSRGNGTDKPSTGAAERLLEGPRFSRAAISPREVGVLFHAVMQHIPLDIAPDASAINDAVRQLVERGTLPSEAVSELVVVEVAAFLSSPLGRRLARAQTVLREQPFFQRLEIAAPAANSVAHPKTSASYVVVQGVMDCLARDEEGWFLIDYKTDHVPPHQLNQRAREYAAQVAVYLEAATTVTMGASVEAYLYFVRARRPVPMERLDLSTLFRRRDR